MARLVSLNVGLPRDVEWQGRVVHTGIWKEPVAGRRRVRHLNIDGDGQGDLGGHGGENRAVYVYQLGSYRHWEEQLGRTDFRHGQFGENFTVEGLADDEVCIGDRYRIGTTVVEVTQPRVTCYRVGLRMNDARMPALLTGSGRPGFYLRVLEEGEVAAGDEIVKLSTGTEAMTVAEVNALLYLPPHSRAQLERALRIPALSPGWKGSFEALLGTGTGGNAGLIPAAAARTAKPGFRSLRVAERVEECTDVVSLVLRPTDGRPLEPALPGQFVVVRLRPSPDSPGLLRSYSLSGPPSAEQYRISVRIEPGGVAGRFIREQGRVGDLIETSAPRGSFVLEPGDGPVVLLSGGIGATPLLAMLHSLAAARSEREVWWLHGSRDGATHPFAAESRALLGALPRAKVHIRYSRPLTEDTAASRFEAPGHLDMGALTELGVPTVADFYLCGPPGFTSAFREGLARAGVQPSRIRTEVFSGGESNTPGIAPVSRPPPHPPKTPEGTGPLVSFARSGLSVRWAPASYRSLLELAEACDVPVRWSCRTGVCHTCESGLISGAVDYEPAPLDAAAEGNLLVCCSRPTGDLVVDL